MRKVQLTAVFWTLLIAVPITALALSLLAYTTEHLTQLTTSLVTLSRDASIGGRGILLEFAQRWPEIAGMIIGQVVLLTIFIVVRQSKKTEEKTNKSSNKH
jgi:hypothetical protein